jgi:hypothetical protein
VNATLSLHKVTAVTISDEKKHDNTIWRELEITTESGRMVLAVFPSDDGMTIKQQEDQ